VESLQATGYSVKMVLRQQPHSFLFDDHPLGARSFCRNAAWMKETKAVTAAAEFHSLRDMALCYPEPESRMVVRRFDYLVSARICRASPSRQAVFQSSNNVAPCFRKNSIAGRFHPSTFSMIPKHASCRAMAATYKSRASPTFFPRNCGRTKRSSRNSPRPRKVE